MDLEASRRDRPEGCATNLRPPPTKLHARLLPVDISLPNPHWST